MSTTAASGGTAYDATVYTETAPPGEESLRLRKTRAAVAYFERALRAAEAGVANAAAKAGRLRAQADAAEAEAARMYGEAKSQLADARRQLADLEG